MTQYNMTKAPSMNEVYSRVNRLAHQLAATEELRLRGAILSRVQEARDKGVDAYQLMLLLNSIEGLGKVSCVRPP